MFSDLLLLLTIIFFGITLTRCFLLYILQESAKTKHPQLHYESKIYMLLQGGSMSLSLLVTNTQICQQKNGECFNRTGSYDIVISLLKFPKRIYAPDMCVYIYWVQYVLCRME